MIDGIVNIYKEKGFTSHDVVAKLRGILHQKKIGHTGTLDPDAEGVLPVCLGKATKVCDMLTDTTKEYVAELLLGCTTDTQDVTGTVLSEQEVNVSEEELLQAIQSFEGDYEQLPPMYSALKVNGKKLYEYAREGIEVERKKRLIHIDKITVEQIDLPVVKIRVQCSKGTYIRTLCYDIGDKLGCGGCMKSLVRTKTAGFCLEQAKKLGEIEEYVKSDRINELIMPIDHVFQEYKKVIVSEEFERFLYNGNRLQPDWFIEENVQEDCVRVYDREDHFVGVYEYKKDRFDYKPLKIFWHRDE